jgi:DNA-binding NtrC family response regulator
VVLATSRQVEVALLPLHLQENAPASLQSGEGFLEAKGRAVARFERDAITRFLGEARGNVSAAAKLAGITRRNFHRLIVKYELDMKTFRSETHKSHN